MKTSSLLLCVLIITPLFCQAKTRVPGNNYAGLSREAAKAFSWFDRLGFPDVKGCPYVRVGTGQWCQRGDNPPENTYISASLLESGTNTFTVLMPDLFTTTFHPTNVTAAAHERVFYEKLDLEEVANKRLQQLKHPPADEDHHMARFGQRIEERAEIFILAWGCARNGHAAIAEALFKHASSMPSFVNREADTPPDHDIISKLEKDIGHAMMWRAILSFGDLAISRSALLPEFEAIVTNYPSSEHVPRAKDTATMLRQMIQEDRNHRPVSAKTWAGLTTRDRVTELIFQLRDQNGFQCSQPGACDIFLNFAGDTNTPAHQLVAIGYDAVPQLIEALNDERFTRSVGYHRDFYFSHYVLRVGDCANAILCKIAGRHFYERTNTSGYMTKDGKARSTKAQVEEWWAGMQKKGERGILVSATESGDENAPAQAEILLAKYPDSALGAITKGLHNAKDHWVRTSLIEIAGKIKGDVVVPLLLAEMKAAPALSSRVAAATALHRRGHQAATPAMMMEWQTLAGTSHYEDGDDAESLVTFLAGSAVPDAIRALGKNLTDRPVALRLTVISAFGENGGAFSMFASGGVDMEPGDYFRTAKEDVRQAIEAVLVAALNDTDERMGMSGTWSGKSFVNPRICDIAGHVLNQLRKEKYDFDLAADLRKRDNQRFACFNTWRRDQHLEAVTAPEPKVSPRAASEITAPLVGKIKAAKSPGKVASELRALEKIGLPALLAAVELLGDLNPRHPLRGQVESLTQRLSLTVTEVVIEEKSARPPADLAAVLERMKASQFTSGAFIDVLLRVTGNPPHGIAGINLKAIRNEDLAGVTLRVRLLTDKADQAGSQKGWSTSTSVKIGKEVALSSAGSSSDDYGKSKEAYKDLEKVIRKATASGAKVPFDIQIQVAQER